jgi:S-(hydroxymethyl)glutathione dehydrogenase / alcohol dehydrogenase
MRAAVLPGIDQRLEVYDDITVDGPGPGEVRIRIVASGVCHSDVSAQNGTLPQPLPAVLGHEGAGEIIGLGENVEGLNVGDHVIVSWVPPCGLCFHCRNHEAHLCLTNLVGGAGKQRYARGEEKFYGFAGTGTWAEECVLPASAAIVIPDDVPYDVASLIGCGVMTGVGAAINTAKVKPGSNVVVFGCGGVGISVIQGARIAGAAEIVAVDLIEGKLEMAKQFGATRGCSPDALDGLKAELTDGIGFDYAFEVIGLPATIRAAYDATRRGGTTVVVGAGRYGDEVKFNPYELFFMEKTLKGCFYGSADVRTDFHRLLRLWRAGKLDLEGMITRRIDVGEINEAFDAMARGEVIRQVIEFK